MIKPFSETIKVEIRHLRVGKKDFSFEYTVFRNGKHFDSAVYHSSHSRSPSYLRKHLKEGYAVNLVLERI